MYTFKVVASIFGGSLFVLIIIVAFLKNPNQDIFDSTIETLMIREGLSTYTEVKDSFPQLDTIAQKMERIGYLKRDLNSLTSGPIASIPEVEYSQIQEITMEIQHLQKSVNTALKKLTTESTDISSKKECSNSIWQRAYSNDIMACSILN